MVIQDSPVEAESIVPIRRPDIRPPKFADKFAELDFEAETMPVISMFEPPEPTALDHLAIGVRGDDLKPRTIGPEILAALPRVTTEQPLVCQIFNWHEQVTWQGIPFAAFLEAARLQPHEDGFIAVLSRDGQYFETISPAEAADPRVLLATGMNGQPLPHQHGGPLRLVVPFVQGYKSVKWVGAVHTYRHDPAGIKRLLGQSKTGRLGQAWLDRLGIEPPSGRPADP